jgi:glycosyltransferase involved in cell wall biosynthesis
MPIPQIADHEHKLAPQMRNSGANRRDGVDKVSSGYSPFSLAIVCDLIEENWPSMDLIGDILLSCLRADDFNGIDATRIRPAMSRRLTAAPFISSRLAFNLDRMLNRFWDYPRFVRRHCYTADVFHVVDHSYAQLVLELPADRTLVTCHDIDTFRCLVEPEMDTRSTPYRAMVRRTLRGLQMAALVVCPSAATRDALLLHDLVPQDRLRVVPNGAHPTCSSEPDPSADLEVSRLLGPVDKGDVDVLHVGSTIPRKRIDVLLRVFAGVKKQFSRARLIRVGGPFTNEQELLLDRLELRDSVVVLPYLERRVLAALYRRVAVAALPSEREGFGLPLLEAMACGTPVVASDLPSLREVGGKPAVYQTVADVQGWADAVIELLTERRENPGRWAARRRDVVARASCFTWEEHTRRMVGLYREVLDGIGEGTQRRLS